MTRPKPFQQATVDAACAVLSAKTGRPRFLVADEAGLGKTIVAQHVIKALTLNKRKPLVVYYVCSSLTIASQNGGNLVKAVMAPGEETETAICAADRLSMLPFEARPTHSKVHLYTLTPDTSLPGLNRKRRDGRKEERALIYHLVEQCWPGLLEADVFQRRASRHWEWTLDRARKKLTDLKRRGDINVPGLRNLFREKTRYQFKLNPGKHIRPVLESFRTSDGKRDDLELISRFRTALVECTFELEGLQPDLVIFDEFQNFKDLVRPNVTINGVAKKPVEPIVKKLRGDHSRSVPLLLLSATPYSLDNQRDKDELFGDHHGQLLNLLCFLYGDGIRGRQEAEQVKVLFKRFGDLICSPRLNFQAIEIEKKAIEDQLTRVMSRTERAQTERAIENSEKKTSPKPIEVETEANDWKVFRHVTQRFPRKYKGTAVSYWRSIPFPMQTMGSGYIAWRGANKEKQRASGRVPALNPNDWKLNKKVLWPHGKLRALVSRIKPDTLCLPWIAPSLPWWSLDRRWKTEEAQRGKVLLFSRFRATPKAVAAALSHEARANAARLGKLPVSNSNLPLSTERMPIFALFYPSLWFTECCDPFEAAGKRPNEVQRLVSRQLVGYLKTRKIKVKERVERREFWRLLAALDKQLGTNANLDWVELPAGVSQAWEDPADSPVDAISQRELRKLTAHALGAPGVVLIRSLLRHYKLDALKAAWKELLELSLHVWRNYFDNQVFIAALRRHKNTYPESLKVAIFRGNLESVLDEYFWYLNQSGDETCKDLLRILDSSLGVRGGRVGIHSPDHEGILFRAQCDVSLPLSQEMELTQSRFIDTPPLRSDQIRTAFNSPFWPNVLTTTSVGQEGLDFHPWCQTLVHWDLPGNPVDLEQREGRIQRFAGLAVRRAMASAKGDDALAATDKNMSPWKTLQALVDEKDQLGEPGLQPWWQYPGSSVKSLFFHLPASEEVYHLEELKRQRAIYRLALGQQHQEDFVRMVSAKDDATLERLSELTPNLSAWFAVKASGNK